MIRSEIRLSSTVVIHYHELVDQWEQGKLLAAPALISAFKSVRLGVALLSDSTYLIVDSGKINLPFKLCASVISSVID
jgi:superfamily II DNA or RNA helicase